MDDIERVKLRTKLLACMAILRNSLAKGNEDIRTAIKDSKFDKAKTFDKVAFTMLLNCKRVIKDEHVDKVYFETQLDLI